MTEKGLKKLGWHTLLKTEIGSVNGWTLVVWGAFNKFPDFFRMGTFIDRTHMKL